MDVEIADVSALAPNQLEAWLQLFESAPDTRFYHHPHWIQSFATHLNSGKLLLAFVSTDQKLQLVMPLNNATGQKRLLHPAHDHLSLNDILVHPELANEPDALFSAIDAVLDKVGEHWLDWQMANVPHNSPLIQRLLETDQTSFDLDSAAAQSANVHWLRTTREKVTTEHWLLKCTRQSASFGCASKDCPPHGKLKRNLRRLRKQIEELGELRVEQVSKQADLERAFDHFLTVEASGWKGQGDEAPAISANPDLVQFYHALLSPSSSGIAAEINLLWCGEDCVAVQFAQRTENCLSLLKIGYDERYAKFSPGSLLLESVLENAKNDALETLSLVTSPPWADRWHPDTVPVWHINRYNKTTLGTALQHIDRLKQMAKSRLRKVA